MRCTVAGGARAITARELAGIAMMRMGHVPILAGFSGLRESMSKNRRGSPALADCCPRNGEFLRLRLRCVPDFERFAGREALCRGKARDSGTARRRTVGKSPFLRHGLLARRETRRFRDVSALCSDIRRGSASLRSFACTEKPYAYQLGNGGLAYAALGTRDPVAAYVWGPRQCRYS